MGRASGQPRSTHSVNAPLKEPTPTLDDSPPPTGGATRSGANVTVFVFQARRWVLAGDRGRMYRLWALSRRRVLPRLKTAVQLVWILAPRQPEPEGIAQTDE